MSPASTRQDGAASILVVAMSGLVLLVGLAAGWATAAVVAQRRAQSAADLVAIGAAAEQQRGRDACAGAERLAGADGARLGRCSLSGADVTVRVELDGPTLLGRVFVVSAEAKAGPR